MENQRLNSVPIGFLLGFFGGCIGLIVALVMGGPKTKTGSIVGVLTALTLGLCLGVLSAAVQILLMNA